MEVENSHRTPSSKRHRHANLMGERDDNEDDEDAATAAEATTSILLNNNNNNNRILRQWHQPASRIYRVSRASGGKDRHSKVYTAKGLRDRRVRLSVSTAIQFYDLQDRLGYDQPSKAIEWLIKAAAAAIAELPSLDTTFPPDESLAHPKQEIVTHIADVEAEPSYNQQSSTSETSKGSVLSLTSRSEIRVKARERARERAKDKDGEKGHVVSLNAQNLNLQSSFTELLTGGGGGGGGGVNAAATNREGNSGFGNFFQRHIPPVTSTADYFTQFGQQQQLKSSHDHHQSIQSEFFGNNNNNNNSNCPIGMVPFADHHHPAEMQQFAFLQDHFFPVAVANGGGDNYNLNFSISSGLTGFHRGTLQSNSPSLHHQFPHHHHHQQHIPVQRLSSQLDGASVPFLFGTVASAATSAHESQYPAGFDGNLQLCDGYKHMELKGKGKG